MVTEAMGVGQIDIDPMVLVLSLSVLSTVLILPKRSVVFYGSAERTYRGGDGVRFYSWQVFRRIMFPAMMRYALPGIATTGR